MNCFFQTLSKCLKTFACAMLVLVVIKTARTSPGILSKADEPAATVSTPAPASTQDESASVVQPDASTSNATTPDSSTSKATSSGTSSIAAAPTESQGRMIWLPLSQEAISSLLGEEGASALEKLNQNVPVELRQAYAMIPLASSSPAGPVLRKAITSEGMQTVLSTVASFLPGSASGKDSAELPTTEKDATTESDVIPDKAALASEQPLAEWVNTPGVGQSVVKSEFLEATVSAEDALRAPIIAALKERVSRLTIKQFGVNDDWQKLVDIAVTDHAVRQFIVSTDTRIEVIPTIDGSKPMRKTYALVEFPESVEQQILGDVALEVKKNRTIILCLCLGVLWLSSVLLSVAFRVSQQQSMLKRLTTLPAIGLMVLPCLLVSGAMIGSMIKGRTIEFPINGDRAVCSIDKVTK